MVRSARHAEVLRRMLRTREREEEREEHLLFGLLHQHLPALRARAPASPPRAGATLRLPRRREIRGPREAHRLLERSGRWNYK